MDAHFDPNQFHPTFLGSESHSAPFEVSMDSFLHKVHEWGLPIDVVEEASANAYDFFHMVQTPLEIGNYTHVNLGNPYTYADDKLTISPEELKSMGIHDKDSLSLVCTHEIIHQVTQTMYAHGQISDWQGELIADKWMGIRAAIENIEPSTVINSMKDGIDSPDHPGGDLRMKHIQDGYDMVKEMTDADVPLTFENLMNRAIAEVNADPNVLPREQAAKMEAANVSLHVNSVPGHDYTQGYTQEEIDRKIEEQQKKIDHCNSVIADKTRLKEIKERGGDPTDGEKYSIASATIDLENAIKERNVWCNTTATKPS